ncbi:hypothetical protein OG948_50585 (plasmid) [Embleya sp. NBC_00888]|uniref:hypothetical protein n=1 Tax=Embleya sp. NBC_00888 TaxID=2975960 RepID=UPI002F91545F|nr:hypothetical protein OG948_50585 [Embleya sp. NBC_00888]
MSPSAEEITRALAPLSAVLAADDFRLEVSHAGASNVMLTITAGPTACPTCLVPEQITRRMAEQHLNKLSREEWLIEVAYPSVASDGAE